MCQNNDLYRINAEAMREARAWETSAQRAAQRSTNVEVMREARAWETSAQRAARRRTIVDAVREARAQRTSEEAGRQHRENTERPHTQDWTDLLVHSHPSPPALCLGASHQCSHCGGRLLSGETDSFYCRGGKLPSLHSLHLLKVGKRCFGGQPSGHTAGNTTTCAPLPQWECWGTRCLYTSQP